MTTLKGTQTEKNLLLAYAGECRDHATYLYFSKAAQKEGYVRVSRIFEETAKHELSHAKNFLKHLGDASLDFSFSLAALGLNNTVRNLKGATESETNQCDTLYPQFAKTAEDEGFIHIAVLFNSIAKAEAFHRRRFARLIEEIESDTAFKRDTPVTWVCTKCGYVYEGTEALQKCPACGHPQGYFEVLTDW